MELNKIHNKDCLEGMKELKDNSIDLIVTDPPYGYSFMGKDWDKVVPHIDIWKQCLRVMKPGAFAFVMSAPRQDVQSQMVVRLTNSGFNCGFTPLYWAYASGFPKTSNIGKMVDKRNGRNIELYQEIGRHIKEKREKAKISIKDLNKIFGYIAGCNWWESQNDNNTRLPNLIDWEKLIKLIKVDEKYTIIIERIEAEREVIGSRITGAGMSGNMKGTESTSFASGTNEVDITTPSTPQAKALDGSYGGFQPKPAVEIILVAMKPLSEKTYVEQALKNGKGITWLDDCRVPYESENDKPEENQTTKVFIGSNNNRASDGNRMDYTQNQQGRFPANLLVSDDVLNNGTNYDKGGSVPNKGKQNNLVYGEYAERPIWNSYNDSGSFSRYFDLDKRVKN